MREIDEFEWARQQTCSALANEAQVSAAKIFAHGWGLPLHNDRWKNWDNFLAVHHANRLCEKDEHVLDAGACRDPKSPSAFLPGLHKLGFTNLHGCNLDEIGQVTHEGVFYTHQDITWTSYPKDYFGFVACLSVIEHGVDWRKYFQEQARILKPLGFLFTSFDYWHNPVDTKGQKAFGVPIKIFTHGDVMQMCLYAKSCGLQLMKAPKLIGDQKVVQWMGMEYTFMNLLMRKDMD